MADVTDDDWEAIATAAGLRYTSDSEPGIARRRCGRGFTFVDADGSRVDGEVRRRIDQLLIPPAWRDVWISSDPDSHLQATGIDVKDRKQYRYHDRWREVRDEAKFAALREFAGALSEIRKRVSRDLGTKGLNRYRAVAAVVRLLDVSLIRVGNDRYVADNDTFGATTLESRHVSRTGASFRIDFVGKGDVERHVDVDDTELVAVIEESTRLGQSRLFGFRDDDGAVFDVGSNHVNDYLVDTVGPCATAKTFRTWGATTIAVRELADASATPGGNGRAHHQTFLAAVDVAAEALGNTRAVCRSCYVAPTIATAAESGSLADAWASSRNGRWRNRAENTTAKLL